MRKRKSALEYIDRLKVLRDATLDKSPPPFQATDTDNLPDIGTRIKEILGLIERPGRDRGNMLFFVMYDIESNKVRYNVVKYLERKGCTRIQKSIFLADLSRDAYQSIRDDLTEIQSMYENHDSIIICPVSTEQLQNMKIIGQNIDVDIIMKSRNTLFF